MRLLILNWRDLSHPRAGGSEVYAQQLAKHWAAAGEDVTYFCAASPGQAATEVIDGYGIVRRGTRFSVYKEAERFFEREAMTRFDVIVDVVNTRPFLAPRWAGSVPVVALVHQVAREVWAYEAPFPVSLAGRYIFEPRWLRSYRDTPVLTVSESSRQSLRQYGLTNVAVVHEGVDEPSISSLPAKETDPTVIFVGRLSSNKRPEAAIAAHQLVRAALPNSQLWVVGDGPLRQRLESRVPAGVQFFGRVDQAMKEEMIARAHVLVATSVREGWGLTVSEAARLGTRAVTYDVPGLRDSVPAAHGVLSRPSPEGLAEQLVRWLPLWVAEGRINLGDAGVVGWNEVADEILGHVKGIHASGRRDVRST